MGTYRNKPYNKRKPFCRKKGGGDFRFTSKAVKKIRIPKMEDILPFFAALGRGLK